VAHPFSLKASVSLAALLLGIASSSIALSQGPPPGGPGGGRGGPGGFGGPGGPGGFGRRPMGGPQQSTALQTPIAALTAGLKLTADQKSQIQEIQDQIKEQRTTLMARPNQGGGDRPDPSTIRANFEKLRTAETKADKDITALLTSAQKQALPVLLQQLDTWREVGIPAELYADLNVTGDQQAKIDAIAKKARAAMFAGGGRRGPGGPDSGPGGGPGGPGGMEQARQKVHDQAVAVLNDDQQKLVADYIEAHPRPERGRGPGGGGGFGPPPGGDGGAPPPPGE
jgi:Spy/CpxP family protein refolding chaperone